MFDAVLDAIWRRDLNAKFEFVFVNRERGQTSLTDRFLNLTEDNHIPTITLSSLKFRCTHNGAPWSQLRESFDKSVLSKLEQFNPDISVMAGYMLFAPEISRHMLVLNQHPALPGGATGKWQEAIWDAIEQDADEHGAMIHIATPQLDRGPVITYCKFGVRGTSFDSLWENAGTYQISELRSTGDENLPLFTAIREAEIQRERSLVVETLKAIADGEIEVTAIVDDRQKYPVDMTCRVDAAMAKS